MSAAKRSYQGQQKSAGKAITAIPNHDASIPASKRLKSSHAEPQSTGLSNLLADPSRHRITAKLTNGVSQNAASKVDESKAVVASGLDTSLDQQENDASSGIDEDKDDELEEDQEQRQQNHSALANGVNGTTHSRGSEQRDGDDADVAMVDGLEDESDADDQPSFGDILKARHPDVIDITAQLTHPEQARTIAPSASTQLVAGHSLTTVLQQALKTNDKDLLESCFQLRDVVAIKNTIQRLPSPLVGQLLARISERMYRRPGRAGALMIWIQWSLVAHGGYLASQPEVLHKIKALNQVIRQRAQGLQPLLQLKGKLDMLNAQLELRRETQTNQRSRAADVNDEAGVVYVEGDPEHEWDDDDNASDSGVRQIEAAPRVDHNALEVNNVNALDEEEEDFDPIQEDESQEEDEEDDVVEYNRDAGSAGMIDIEAEESDGLEEDSQGAALSEDDEEDDDDEQDSEADSASAIDDDDDDDDDNSSHTSYNEVTSLPGQRGRRT